MKIIIFLFISYFSFFSYSFSENHLIDCNQFDKISAKYIECKTKNLKSNLNKKQSEIKSKIENVGETESGKNFKKSTLGQKLLKLKKSKTGSDFLKKDDN